MVVTPCFICGAGPAGDDRVSQWTLRKRVRDCFKKLGRLVLGSSRVVRVGVLDENLFCWQNDEYNKQACWSCMNWTNIVWWLMMPALRGFGTCMRSLVCWNATAGFYLLRSPLSASAGRCGAENICSTTAALCLCFSLELTVIIIGRSCGAPDLNPCFAGSSGDFPTMPRVF